MPDKVLDIFPKFYISYLEFTVRDLFLRLRSIVLDRGAWSFCGTICRLRVIVVAVVVGIVSAVVGVQVYL